MARTRKSENGYGIGSVARITGLTDHTIRVWERRYDAVVAKRTETGRRVYSAANVEKLGLLKQLTDKGVAISKIAKKSNAALRKAVQEYERAAAAPVPDIVRVAVLGDQVRNQISECTVPLDVAVSDDDPTRFSADLEKQPVDLIVVETAVLDGQTLKQLKTYLSVGRARGALLVYNFGRKQDVDRASKLSVLTLRAPVNGPELQSAIHSLMVGIPLQQRNAAAPAPRPTDPAWRFSGAIAPRRFSKQQLTQLANISSPIDCECPQNLAQIVSDLTAFEIYSSQCANRDADDAALHHYLHQTTAAARELIEIALEKVIVAEGISL